MNRQLYRFHCYLHRHTASLFLMTRIDATWKYMQPNENEKYHNFRFEQYYQRMLTNEKLKHIPKPVFEQWVYHQNQEPNSLKNYGWLNFEKIEFLLCEWDVATLDTVRVINNFMPYYTEKSSHSDFKEIGCIPEDKRKWSEEGTWRTPPIIIDIESLLSPIPDGCELNAPYQLVEGHTRLGYLHSMKRILPANGLKLASKHWIYLMREK